MYKVEGERPDEVNKKYAMRQSIAEEKSAPAAAQHAGLNHARDKLSGLKKVIFAERDRKLEEARRLRLGIQKG